MKKNNAIICIISCASAIAAGPGCGMLKNMDEMHNAAVAMNDKMDTTNHQMSQTNDQIISTNNTTQHMAKTTDGMAGNVAATACIAGATYTALRQGNTLQARTGDDALGKMNSAQAIEDKIFEAGAYVQAFEFQIPNCGDPNADKYQKGFYMQAAKEFTRVLPNFLTTDRSKWSVSTTSTDNKTNNVYALAVSLQEINENIVNAYRLGFLPEKPQSMLDLIESSFTRKIELAADPSQATLADHEFLVNEDLLVQLLQIRMNFLATMALAKVSNLETKGFLGMPGLVREAGMLLHGWEPNLRQYGSTDSLERIKEFTRYLYGSNDMRAYLISIGVTPKFDPLISRMYAHMSITDALQAEIPNPKSKSQIAFNNTQKELKKYLEQLDIYFGRKAFYKIPELDHPEFFKD